MRILPLALIGGAGLVLAYVAWHAPARDYVAPTPKEIAAHAPAPQSLQGSIPDDCVVRTIEVQGMCCLGCTGKIYERLAGTPGLVDAAVSFDRGVAEVVTRKDADVSPFVAALRFDKYEPRLVH